MKKPSDATVLTSPDYRQFIRDLKARIISAHISAIRAVNRDLTLLYWDIGWAIIEKQKVLGWGASVLEQPVQESSRQSSSDKAPDALFHSAKQLISRVYWGHHVELLKKVKPPAARLWYLRATAQFGWTRNVRSVLPEKDVV